MISPLPSSRHVAESRSNLEGAFQHARMRAAELAATLKGRTVTSEVTDSTCYVSIDRVTVAFVWRRAVGELTDVDRLAVAIYRGPPPSRVTAKSRGSDRRAGSEYFPSFQGGNEWVWQTESGDLHDCAVEVVEYWIDRCVEAAAGLPATEDATDS